MAGSVQVFGPRVKHLFRERLFDEPLDAEQAFVARCERLFG
jgi:hypothetical protein